MLDIPPTKLFEVYREPQRLEDGRPVYGILRHEDYLKKLSPSPKYCTISDVWGERQYIDVPSIDWKVPITSEDKLRFIFETCARLGFKYVWCDVLCLRQDGAYNDHSPELLKMKQYYANSTATIVFGQNYDTFASRWSKIAHILDTWRKDRTAKLRSTLQAVWEGLGDIDNVVHQAHDLWFWRVWTLQEAVVPTVFSRLITSDGAEMNLPLLCDLIDWTYAALGTKTLSSDCGDSQHGWIHPGEEVVNDRGWWKVSDNLKTAIDYRNHPIHPLQLLNITRFRQCFRPVDRLRGAYAIINESWHVDPIDVEKEVNEDSREMGQGEKEMRLFEVTWEKTVDKYIEREDPDCAPLLTMRVTDAPNRTWGIGEVQANPWVETHKVGSVTAEFGRWINRTAQLVHEGSLKGSLRLHASGVDHIQEVKCTHPYGDGSGELYRILETLQSLVEDHDISSILTILQRAVNLSQRHYDEVPKPQTGDAKKVLKDLGAIIKQNSNAVNSGLRGVFNGWDRWIVATEDRRAFLVWFPWRQDPAPGDRLGNCSLIWPSPGHNDWAFVGEGGSEGYRKVGTAFVNSTHAGPETLIVVL